MSKNQKIYEKQNSLVEIRHRVSQAEVLPRFRKVLSELNFLNLSDYKKSIIKDAIAEILRETTLEHDFPPFKLHSYNFEEISKGKMLWILGTESDWIRLDCSDWIHGIDSLSGSVGLHSIALHSIALHWIGLGWIE